MKNLINVLSVMAAVIMCTACENEDPGPDLENKVTGTGEIVTRNLTLDPFVEIHLTGVSNMYVTISNEQNIVLKASTGDPFSETTDFIFELDTIPDFNSPFLIQQTISQAGGLAEL